MLNSKPVRIVLALIVAAAVLVAVVVIFDIDPEAWMASSEAAQTTTTPSAASLAEQPAAQSDTGQTEAGQTEGTTAADSADSAPPADAEAPAAGDAGAAPASAGAAAGAATFTIDQSASEARFFINEVLLGVPTEVKGVTSLISGTVMVDPANPAASQVGVIQIDANDLRTDRNLRNRAIRRFILETGNEAYRYITFTPTAISGLPESAAPGDSFTFQVTGDLTIRDITQPVTFDVELTADSATQISGLAKTTVRRSDFELTIPSAPGVADVTDEVRLELAFTARG